MKKGEIWWAEIPSPVGKRPALLLTRDEAYSFRTNVTIAPLTTTIRKIPTCVHLSETDGVPKKCVVNLDSIYTIEKGLLKTKICDLSEEKMHLVNKAIRFALDI